MPDPINDQPVKYLVCPGRVRSRTLAPLHGGDYRRLSDG